MLMGPQNLPENIRRVQERIKRAAAASGRNVDSVTLVAVAKSQPPEVVQAAARCGLTEFGESYVQEALGKIAALVDLGLTWHFVGKIQATRPATSPRILPGCTGAIGCASPSACPSSAPTTPRP